MQGPSRAWLDTDIVRGKPVYDSMAALPAALWLPVAVADVAADVAVTTVLPPMVVVPAVEGALSPFDSLWERTNWASCSTVTGASY